VRHDEGTTQTDPKSLKQVKRLGKGLQRRQACDYTSLVKERGERAFKAERGGRRE
jgi:hypothetical protein